MSFYLSVCLLLLISVLTTYAFIRQIKKTYPMQCYVFRKCTVKGSTIYFSADEVGAGRGSGMECVWGAGGGGGGGAGGGCWAFFFFSQIFCCCYFVVFFLFVCFLLTKNKNNYFLHGQRANLFSKDGESYSAQMRTDFLQVGIGALRGCVRTISTIGTDALQVRD